MTHKPVQLMPGVVAHVSEDVTPETLSALKELASLAKTMIVDKKAEKQKKRDTWIGVTSFMKWYRSEHRRQGRGEILMQAKDKFIAKRLFTKLGDTELKRRARLFIADKTDKWLNGKARTLNLLEVVINSYSPETQKQKGQRTGANGQYIYEEEGKSNEFPDDPKDLYQ